MTYHEQRRRRWSSAILFLALNLYGITTVVQTSVRQTDRTTPEWTTVPTDASLVATKTATTTTLPEIVVVSRSPPQTANPKEFLVRILFPENTGDFTQTSVASKLLTMERDPAPDYGGLSLFHNRTTNTNSSTKHPLPSHPRSLHDRDTDNALAETDRVALLRRMDGKPSESTLHTEELRYPRPCHRPNWVETQRSMCHMFHEMDIEASVLRGGSGGDRNDDTLGDSRSRSTSSSMTYLNAGYFRTAWLLSLPSSQSVVLKTLRPVRDMNKRTLDTILVEAVVMEALSASPQIANLYGHCGFSLAVEYGHEFMSLVEANTTTTTTMTTYAAMAAVPVAEKLDLAIAMAESVAELHGFRGGVITSDDLKPEQWLRAVPSQNDENTNAHASTRQSTIKLNDFNNGMFMTWNYETQQYCPYPKRMQNVLLSPEQLSKKKLTEQSDVFSLGSAMYNMLTTLPVFHNYERKQKERLVREGKAPSLLVELRNDHNHNNSLVYSNFVDIIADCWVTDPTKRDNVFSIVAKLKETKQLYDKSVSKRVR